MIFSVQKLSKGKYWLNGLDINTDVIDILVIAMRGKEH